MKKDKIIKKLYACLDTADMDGFEKYVNKFIDEYDESEVSQELAIFLAKEYTASRADTIALLMELIIRQNPNLALINYPENHFFRVVIITGSIELFECYTEEAIEPHLENASDEDYKAYYTKLLHLAAKLNTLYSDQYEPIIKGINFNGGFPNESDDSLLSIHKSDFETMNDTVNLYNIMVGRRNVIKALMDKAGMKH